MAKIRKIEIENFRCIKKLVWHPTSGINCLIGPGDSGKSTVLDAIYLCLGARRNLQFFDTDFFGLEIQNPICITLAIGDLDDSMKSIDNYGLFLRSYNVKTNQIDDEPSEEKETDIILSLNLCVTKDLDPVFTLLSDRARSQGVVKTLSWKDRAALEPARIGTYANCNFNWQRGSVLNRITDERVHASLVLIEALRNARETFGIQADKHLEEALHIVTQTAQEFGVSIGGTARALLDMKSVASGGETIALHGSDGVPLRALGVGSARLLVASLQRKVLDKPSIVLSDELEYGLEPHRIIRFLGSLGAKEENPGQVFLTTHSPVALKELSAEQLFVLRKNSTEHYVKCVRSKDHVVTCVRGKDHVQGTIRCYPEAFLSTSVVICEGASEVGLLRGLDLYRVENGMTSLAAQGVALVDGKGVDNLYTTAMPFKDLGYRVIVFRDNDKKPDQKTEDLFARKEAGEDCKIVTYQEDWALEDAMFCSLSVAACKQLIEFAVNLYGKVICDQIKTASQETLQLHQICDEIEKKAELSPHSRQTLSKASRFHSGWFKTIYKMEEIAHKIIGADLSKCALQFRSPVETIFEWAKSGVR